MQKNKIILKTLLLISALSLGACGVKPPYVDPPQGAEHEEFPAVYPDPATDPKPGLENK